MPDQEPVLITVNGKEVEARPGELVIEAAERSGTYIPRFCYHPRMQPVGMCRMCVVDIDTGRGPALQPACMIPVAPGMVVDTESAATTKAQDGILEFLLVNHPLDCPVCDKGGECPLQDQTMAYGPGESRFVEEKRHFAKPIPVSDLVALDRERCILCDRCTRFAKDVAGDPLIHFIDRGNQTQVNTFPEHEFASYFSGNTVQICPVGALTATAYRFKARPWDLDQVESTCTSCSVGCRVVVQSSRNELLRYQGVDADPVNWGWLCDKGRFDFQALNSEERLDGPLARGADDALAPTTWASALASAASAIRDALDRNGPAGIAVLGGSRLTNESAYAWAKLAKGVIGTDNVDAQLGDGLPAEVVLGLPRATIDQACAPGGTILLLAPDLKEQLPVLYLRLRHAVRNDGVRVVEVTPTAGSTSELATHTLVHQPGAAGEVVRALLAGGGSAAGGLEPEELAPAAELLAAGPVTVVLGRPNEAESAAAVVDAAVAIHEAHAEVRFLSALRRGNVHGALDMGLAPGVLPGRTDLAGGGDWFRAGGWATVPEARGLDAVGILDAAANGRIDVLVLLGADPLGDVPDRQLVARALAGARTVVAVDQFRTESVDRADVVLPAAGYGEVDGTTTNLEGRVSVLNRKVTPRGTARPDWAIAAEIAQRLGADLGATSPEEIWDEIEALAPSHAGLTRDLLASAQGADGIVVPRGGVEAEAPTGPTSEVDPEAAAHAVAAEASDDPGEAQAAEAAAAEAQAGAEAEDGADGEGTADGEVAVAAERPAGLVLQAGPPVVAPPVDAYSLRLVATRRLYDLGVGVQRSPALAHLAAPAPARLNPYDFDRLGVEAGADVELSAARGSITLPVEPDDRVPRGTVAVVLNQPGPAVAGLIDAAAPVTEVRIEVAR
ncbi:MAG: NADH-quinone oxidoreductase subunit NuoG [Acidimicrobiia bacterium]